MTLQALQISIRLRARPLLIILKPISHKKLIALQKLQPQIAVLLQLRHLLLQTRMQRNPLQTLLQIAQLILRHQQALLQRQTLQLQHHDSILLNCTKSLKQVKIWDKWFKSWQTNLKMIFTYLWSLHFLYVILHSLERNILNPCIL